MIETVAVMDVSLRPEYAGEFLQLIDPHPRLTVVRRRPSRPA